MNPVARHPERPSRHPERSEGSQPNVEILRSAQDDVPAVLNDSTLDPGPSTLDPRPSALGPQPSALLIGYGNPYRRDDGVAFHIINGVRARLGRPPLPQDDTGEDDLGHEVDTVMAHQLVPELAPLLQRYGRVLFIDAHAGSIPEPVRLVRVEPDAALQATTHHFGPGLLLSLAAAGNGVAPEGWLLSVRGYDFDFGDALSEACAALVPNAVERALELARSAVSG